MGAAWRGPSQVGQRQWARVLDMVKRIRGLDMEVRLSSVHRQPFFPFHCSAPLACLLVRVLAAAALLQNWLRHILAPITAVHPRIASLSSKSCWHEWSDAATLEFPKEREFCSCHTNRT